jgi:hypothetical protein
MSGLVSARTTLILLAFVAAVLVAFVVATLMSGGADASAVATRKWN